jgi:dipeptidyl-peptidase-4
MDLGVEEDIYLARVAWLPGGELVAQIENRAQTRLDLIRFDPQTGKSVHLLQETNDVWINLHNMFWPLEQSREDGGSFIWASERTGFKHLYLYDDRGNLVRALTQGDWLVDKLVSVDEKGGTVYFTASCEGPLESQLYSVSLNGGEPRRITQEAGTHAIVIDHEHRHFVDIHSAIDKPPTVTVRLLGDGTIVTTLHGGSDPRVEALKLQSPRLVTLQSRDGVTLHGAIFMPPEHSSNSNGSKQYPTIVSVYGGPHAQRVTNSWRTTLDMRAQYLSRQGFLVFILDNRGSARRGLAFEGAIKHRMGQLEVDDQVDGVRWLVAQGLADPRRVGIYGWSYGGYMAAMCLTRAPETFRVAVAGAPVTHYDGYDTHYTERYMGTPQENPDGYEIGSVMHHAANIQGNLLIIHGLVDENVHFRHTARLINALIAARIPYDLLLFPDERHLPRKFADRVFMEERIRDHFLKHL